MTVSASRKNKMLGSITKNLLTEENRLSVSLETLDECELAKFKRYNSGENFFFFSIKVKIWFFDLTIKGINFLQEACVEQSEVEKWINDPKKLIHTMQYCRKL